MDGSAFRGMEKLWGCMATLLFIFLPLGIWKTIEIIIWLFKHIRITTV